MRVRIPPSLVQAADSPLIVDTVYFVVRVLRNTRRGYINVEVSTEPSPEARRLAEKAIKEIEAAERKSVTQIDDGRIDSYISKLNDFLTTNTTSDSGPLLQDAKKALRQMRALRT